MSSFVQISEAASIGLHAMVLIAKGGGELVSVKTISQATDASENHLAKVMQRLSKAELVHSARGPKGGFILAKDPASISFLDIYEAIEGRIRNETCAIHREACSFKGCMFGGLIGKTTREFVEYFSKTTLSELAGKL